MGLTVPTCPETGLQMGSKHQVGLVPTTLILQIVLGEWSSMSLGLPKWTVKDSDLISEPTLKCGQSSAAQSWCWIS